MNPGGMNFQDIMQQAQRLQEELEKSQAELGEARLEGSAGGGVVTATVSGFGELLDLTIDPAAIDGDDPQDTAETIADLVLAAVRDAAAVAERLRDEKMGPFTEGLGGALGGGGLPGLPGMPGMPGIPGLPPGM